MLDVPWVGIVRIRSLKMRSEHDLRTERGGIHGHGSMPDRTWLDRKAGRAAVAGTAWFGTIQIATDPRYRSSPLAAPRFLAAVRQLQHRAPTLLLMRAHTCGRNQH